MLNGPAKDQTATPIGSQPSTRKSAASNYSSASASYLSTCSKVALDAYEREVQKLQTIKEQEQLIDELMLKKAENDQEIENNKKNQQRAELLKTAHFVAHQMREREVTEKLARVKEQADYNLTYGSVPPTIVAAFPRIVELPQDVRRNIQKAKQAQMKAALEAQIAIEKQQREKERCMVLIDEKKKAVEDEMKVKNEDETAAEKAKERKARYQEELRKDIQCKEMKKINAKRLESIEFEGVRSLHQLGTCKSPTQESPYTYAIPMEAFGTNEKPEMAEKVEKSEKTEKEFENPENLEKPKGENDLEDENVSNDLALIEGYFQEDGNKTKPSEPKNSKPDETNKKGTSTNPQKTCKPPEKDKVEAGVFTEKQRSDAEKLAKLLEKKQKKTNELLQRIEDLERKTAVHTPGQQRRYSLGKLRTALSREGFRYVGSGRGVRVSGDEVYRSLSSRQSSAQQSVRGSEAPPRSKPKMKVWTRKKSEDSVASRTESQRYQSGDKAQKIAYDRYLSELEAQVLSFNITQHRQTKSRNEF